MKEYFVAMPEHLARIFKATRSPRSILRTGPLTVAQWVMGVRISPSFTCHSTLDHSALADLEFESQQGRASGGQAYVQSSWRKTSSKNGTPAMIPLTWKKCQQHDYFFYISGFRSWRICYEAMLVSNWMGNWKYFQRWEDYCTRRQMHSVIELKNWSQSGLTALFPNSLASAAVSPTTNPP